MNRLRGHALGRRIRALCVLALLVASLATIGGAAAAKPEATPYADIASAGPLNHVYLGNDVSFQVAHTGDTAYEIYPPAGIPGDGGILIYTGGTLYSPDFANHSAGTATSGLGAYTPFTAVSQSAVTGSGTSGDPYKVVTVVDAGTTGLRITQTDRYIVGDEFYRTDVAVANTGGSAASLIFYRAEDCYLGGSDTGYGVVITATGTVGCSVNPDNTPPGRIEEFVPLTSGSNYYEAYYNDLWTYIGTQHIMFPDTCDCATAIDNSMGLSWSLNVAAGGTSNLSFLTIFSPLGQLPLQAAKTADASTAIVNGTDGYTITFSNPNAAIVRVNAITDTLPAGFSYIAGSTTGVTTTDPAIAGQTLVWAGSFDVPAQGSISLHFRVNVAGTAGTYYNNVTGSAEGGYSVAGTGDTAPITIIVPTSVALTAVTGASSPGFNPWLLALLLVPAVVWLARRVRR